MSNIIQAPAHRDTGWQREEEEVEEFTFNPSTHVSPPIDINHYSGPYIHRLPLELLQQVFLLVVNEVPGCPSIFSFEYWPDKANRFGFIVEPSFRSISANFAGPPLVFTRVCRFWRAVAYSTPDMWSRIRVVTSCESKIRPLRPFLPSLLRFWLACAGRNPLTLHIVSRPDPGVKYIPGVGTRKIYSQLHGILFAEMGRRLETVTVSGVPFSNAKGFGLDIPQLDTPQLKTLECYGKDFHKFNAPNLRRLRIFDCFSYCISLPTPTTTSILHLHLQTATARDICRIAVTSPQLETLVLDHIYLYGNHQRVHTTHPCLASITLPVYPDISFRQGFISIFDGLHLPKLQELTLVGQLGEPEVSHVMVALDIASYHVRTVEFRTDPRQSEVDVGSIVEPLLSSVDEVIVRHGPSGELLFRRGQYNG